MANIIQFPEKTRAPTMIQGYRMSFYSETEIDLALLCVNTWGFKEKGYTRRDLSSIDPVYIKECLIRGYNSDLIALPGKKLINKIIDGMEPIEFQTKIT